MSLTSADRERLGQLRLSRTEIAALVARDLQDGWFVNLGIGMPTGVAERIDPALEVVLHSENGVVGFGGRPLPGEEDWDLVDAGKVPVTLLPGGSFMSHADSFALIRGRHLDLAVLGAFQVSAAGDLANWSAPDVKVPAVGGAMDLAQGAKQVWAMLTLAGSDARIKLLRECTYSLTARQVVTRVYTDLGVIAITARGFAARALAPGVQLSDIGAFSEVEICDETGAADE